MIEKNQFELTNFPNDLYSEIAKYLSPWELQNWRNCNRFFHRHDKLHDVLLKKLEEKGRIKKVVIGGKENDCSLLLREDGRVYTPQLCSPTGEDEDAHIQPVEMGIKDHIKDITISNTASYFLKNDGTVLVYGQGEFGELGCGEITKTSVPINIRDLNNVIQITAGSGHVLFLKKDGSVWGCGKNDCGQLGIGDQTNRFTPVQIPNLNNINMIAAGSDHSFFVNSEGMGFACGTNCYGELGIESFYGELSHNSIARNFLTPHAIKISSGQKIKQISVSSLSGPTTHILMESGEVFFCGCPSSAFQGNQFDHVYTAPEWLSNLKQIKQLATGRGHALFLQKDGSVLGCGSNHSGQLGFGEQEVASKLELFPIKQVNSIFAKGSSSFFITENKQLFLCGWIYLFKSRPASSPRHTRFKVPTPIINLNRDIDEIITIVRKYKNLDQPTDTSMEKQLKINPDKLETTKNQCNCVLS